MWSLKAECREQCDPSACNFHLTVDASCTGTATEVAGVTPICDLDAATDGTAECPAGCTEVQPELMSCTYNDYERWDWWTSEC